MPDSPAAELRQAASLLRERANAASTGERWESAKHYDALYMVDLKPSLGLIDLGEPTDNSLSTDGSQPFENPRFFLIGHEQAEYIASMHPAVALAVADWLENEADAADLVQRTAIDPHEMLGLPDRHALAVARAVLESAR